MGKWLAWTEIHARDSKINGFPELSLPEEPTFALVI
jgi:hypothetical protein